jgi:GT2 family glycosyltransferase
MPSNPNHPFAIGVVAIGRNEGERLRACLLSARRDCTSVVYVDSGSTDGSVALAGSMGVEVVELDLSRPFTAARARNEGFARLLQIAPAVDAVQFVDGDCEIVQGWIATAATALADDPQAAVICGRRRERYPRASIYNLLCDMEWNTPVGIALACGGDALIRVTAFQQVNGYDGTVIAGEEPEMCVRLRHAGWTIHRIDAEMTLHDAAMTRLGQWWKRNIRNGHAYAQANAMHGQPPERFREREVRSIEVWAAVPVLVTLIATGILAAIAPPGAVWLAALGMLPLLLYPLLALKVARSRARRGDSMADALLYGVSVTIGKFPQWSGVRRFRAAQKAGVRTELIEYKGGASR